MGNGISGPKVDRLVTDLGALEKVSAADNRDGNKFVSASGAEGLVLHRGDPAQIDPAAAALIETMKKTGGDLVSEADGMLARQALFDMIERAVGTDQALKMLDDLPALTDGRPLAETLTAVRTFLTDDARGAKPQVQAGPNPKAAPQDRPKADPQEFAVRDEPMPKPAPPVASHKRPSVPERSPNDLTAEPVSRYKPVPPDRRKKAPPPSSPPTQSKTPVVQPDAPTPISMNTDGAIADLEDSLAHDADIEDLEMLEMEVELKYGAIFADHGSDGDVLDHEMQDAMMTPFGATIDDEDLEHELMQDMSGMDAPENDIGLMMGLRAEEIKSTQDAVNVHADVVADTLPPTPSHPPRPKMMESSEDPATASVDAKPGADDETATRPSAAPPNTPAPPSEPKSPDDVLAKVTATRKRAASSDSVIPTLRKRPGVKGDQRTQRKAKNERIARSLIQGPDGKPSDKLGKIIRDAKSIVRNRHGSSVKFPTVTDGNTLKRDAAHSIIGHFRVFRSDMSRMSESSQARYAAVALAAHMEGKID